MQTASSRFHCRMLAAAAFMVLVSPLPAQAPAPRDAYLDPSLPLAQRVADLVSRMTLDEKVSQMQNDAPAIPRLHIAAYNWWNEGLHGVARSGYATVFPQAIGLAATWDTDLIDHVADTISTEARAKYNQAQREGNTPSTMASPSGRPISTSIATRAGDADRKPTAKIRFSPAASAPPL